MNTLSASTNKKPGFTLIEILVVSAILVMLLLTASTMFMTFLVSNAKTNVRQQLKAEGQNAVNKIEHELRNARAITSACPINNAGTISYTDLDNNAHTITSSAGQITVDGIVLTTNFALANPVQFTCAKDVSQGSTFVRFTFTLGNRNVGEINTAVGGITEQFNGQVAVRNF